MLFFGGNDLPSGIGLRRQMPTIPGLSRTTFAGTDGIRTSQFAQTIGITDGGPVYSTLTPTDAGFVAPTGNFVQQYTVA